METFNSDFVGETVYNECKNLGLQVFRSRTIVMAEYPNPIVNKGLLLMEKHPGLPDGTYGIHTRYPETYSELDDLIEQIKIEMLLAGS